MASFPAGRQRRAGLLGAVLLSDQQPVAASFRDAAERLTALAGNGCLEDLSRAAHADGLARLTRPARPDIWLISALAQVRHLDPVYRCDRLNLGLRWDATDLRGAPFTALDANITLIARGPAQTQLVLTAAYRPPAACRADGATLGRLAAATLRALTADLASALASEQPGLSPGQAPGRARGPAHRPPEPGGR